MPATTLKQGTGKELRDIFAQLTASIGDSLGALVGRELTVQPGVLLIQDARTIARSLSRGCAIARGTVGREQPGPPILTLIELPDAIAMAGLLMMTPEDVIAERRKRGSLEGEDTAAFGELGNVICSGFGNVLRDRFEGADVTMSDQTVIQPGTEATDATEALATGPLVTFGVRLKLGEYPESTGMLAIDLATAEAWNGGPLTTADGEDVTAAGVSVAGSAAAKSADDDQLERIPAAPIRGTLAAFVVQPDALRTLRLSCRRVGLELRRHGRGEIPNPAAHRNEIVVLDVLPGHDRRFDWCRRVKEMSETTRVLLLIHHPSRARVTQAFLSRADAILGFPCEEPQLSQKLGQLIPDLPPPPEDA